MARGVATSFLGGVLLTTAASAMVVFALSRGAERDDAAPRPDRVKVLIGTIEGSDPPHLYIKGVKPASDEEFDVITGPYTEFYELIEWKPGEKERAEKAYSARIDALAPKDGDPIPHPPLSMKLVRMSPDRLSEGMVVGVMGVDPIVPGEPILATVIRPLIGLEIERGNVSSTFPLH